MGLLLLLTLPAHTAPPAAAHAPTSAKAIAAPPAGLHVALPHAGAYAYWVQAKLGAVSAMPVTVNAQQISLPAAAGGETLYVLDKDNGCVAQTSLAATPDKPMALAVADFKPILPAASSLVVASTPTPPPVRPPAPDTGSGLAHLLTAFFGLLVASGVAWVLWKLIQGRGQPLIAAARHLGVDVPDPADTPEEDPRVTHVYTPPAPRAPERIPDEASAPPPLAAPARRATVGTTGMPQIVGVQGIAAGSAFAVLPGEVVIGRDGDNGIVLAENTVSRRHARLLRDDAGRIILTDEGSANGVYVNGKRITQTDLAPGDQIQIGDSYFRLEA